MIKIFAVALNQHDHNTYDGVWHNERSRHTRFKHNLPYHAEAYGHQFNTGDTRLIEEFAKEYFKKPREGVLSFSMTVGGLKPIKEELFNTILKGHEEILDFYENEVKKLGNFDFVPENDMNNYNVVLKTPNYLKYKDNHKEVIEKLNHKNTMWKAFNGRSKEFTDVIQADEIDRKMCASFPMVPVIDFEKKKIIHCSKKFANNTELSRMFELTQENVDKMMNFQLFKYESYCKTCTEWVPPKGHFPMRKYAKLLTESERLQDELEPIDD